MNGNGMKPRFPKAPDCPQPHCLDVRSPYQLQAAITAVQDEDRRAEDYRMAADPRAVHTTEENVRQSHGRPELLDCCRHGARRA